MIILEQGAMMTRLFLTCLYDTVVKMSVNHFRCTSTTESFTRNSAKVGVLSQKLIT